MMYKWQQMKLINFDYTLKLAKVLIKNTQLFVYLLGKLANNQGDINLFTNHSLQRAENSE